MSCVIANRVNIKNLTRETALLTRASAVGFVGRCADAFAVHPHFLAYQINRLGILYGRYLPIEPGDGEFSDEKRTLYQARIEFIYEPPQEATEKGFVHCVENDESRTEADHVRTIAELWGFYPVGLFVSRQAFDPEHVVTAGELVLLGRLWKADSPHPMCLAITSPSKEGPPFIQAFEISRQVLELALWELWDTPANSDAPELHANEEVYIGNHYSQSVDTGFFVLPTAICRHPEDLFRCDFQIENRNDPQLRKTLAALIRRTPGTKKLSVLKDFHLLLFLMKIDPDLANDVFIAILSGNLPPELLQALTDLR